MFSRDWMCSAWISGFGLKNSLRSGVSSLRIQRSGAAVRLEQRRVFERVVRQLRRLVGRLRLPELLEQIGPHAARVEELLELDRGQLADLLLGVVDAALLADARADLLHDLLDVDRVGADVEIGHNSFGFSAARSPDPAHDAQISGR